MSTRHYYSLGTTIRNSSNVVLCELFHIAPIDVSTNGCLDLLVGIVNLPRIVCTLLSRVIE